MKLKNAHGEDVDIKVETEYQRHLSISPIGIPILGFEDRYGVTPWGLVYNIKTKKYLKPMISKSGYAKVVLTDDKGAKWHLNIHSLIVCSLYLVLLLTSLTVYEVQYFQLLLNLFDQSRFLIYYYFFLTKLIL